uniref:RNA binding motif protein 48 n=1 Tax=Salmo trutta TaxID=8032 RepID=A0A674DCW9_SALTR
MAAPINSSSLSTPEVYKHHEQHNMCPSQPNYRKGRRPKEVKVYTINLESRYLMLSALYRFGLDEYPAEEFRGLPHQVAETHQAAKRYMDERVSLEVYYMCYAPEYETVEDTRLKLQDRRRYVNSTAQNKGTDAVLVEYYQNYICHSQHKHDYYDEKAPNVSGTPSSSRGNRGMVKRLSKNPPPAVPSRFIPRTTHLENRKRKMVETSKDFLPKMDMADESLNTTANMVRNTLKTVYSWSFYI